MSDVKISPVSDFTTFDRTHVVDSIDLSGMKLKYRVVLNTLCDMTFNSPFSKWIDTHGERESGVNRTNAAREISPNEKTTLHHNQNTPTTYHTVVFVFQARY